MRGLAVACMLAGCAWAQGEFALEWSARVTDNAFHNAFTDLVRWKDQYYLCYREGESHMSMDGRVQVMRSVDMRQWELCGTLDTFGDDRDPHFAANDGELRVYFGVWDLKHAEDSGTPDRNRVRSHFASTTDGATWSKVQGVYESGYWLWRVRWHDGAWYSAAYTAVRPKPESRETRLLRSADGVAWDLVSVVTTEHMAGEADLWWNEDGSMELITRTNDEPGNALWFRMDPSDTWSGEDVGARVHSPAVVQWKDRLFVAGRGRGDDGSNTTLWELVDGKAVERLVLPSGGDTSYPGLLVDPASVDADVPAFLISWYSQHESAKPAAAVYVGRIGSK